MRLGRYQLLTRIASGGMADVYKAKLTGIEGFEKTFAIKKILPHWSKNREFINMLIDEARILLHLNHANIVSVFELGLEEEDYYLVMEYVEGVDLKKLLNQLNQGSTKLPLNVVVLIIREIARGLQYAHDKRDKKRRPLGIVHRDISPQNILLGFEGDIKITDFGIAKVVGKTHETVAGTLKGKFSYMSPEQAMGQEVDQRTDIFALGILFFEMLTGERCFKGKTDLETLEAVRKAEIKIPKKLEANLSDELKLILFGMLKKNREERYQSSSQIVEDLLRLELVMGLTGGKDALIACLKSGFTEWMDTQVESTLIEDGATRIETLTEVDSPRHTKVLVSRSLFLEEAAKKTLVEQVVAPPKKIPWRRVLYFGFSVVLVALLSAFLIRTFFDNEKSREEPLQEAPLQVAPAPIMQDAPSPPAGPKEVLQAKTALADFKASYSIKAYPEGATIRVRFGSKQSVITNDVQTKSFEISEPKEFFASIEKTGYVPQTFRFVLGPKQINFSREVNLKKASFGTLMIAAKPWGRISVPGLVSGADSPLSRNHVPTGSYTVKVFYPPLKKTVVKTVRVEENTTIKCQADFLESPTLNCK